MNLRTVASIFGFLFLVAALSGLFATPPPPDAPPLTVTHGHGLALGLLPINTPHNIVHLLFGILGVAAGVGAVMTARRYLQVVAASYGLLVLMGLSAVTNTTFGLIPIWGNDVWFHLLLAIPAAFFGFVHRERSVPRFAAAHR